MYFYKEKKIFHNSNIIVFYNDGLLLKDILKTLDSGGMGVLFFVDNKNKLIGMVTDGDIRRAILDNRMDLKSIINRAPITMNEEDGKELIFLKLKEVQRMHMPIVNNSGILIDIATLDDFKFKFKSNWVVIMAGGLGTRLGDLTKNTPKPMLNVANQPMMKHILDMFISHGFIKFMFSVNYKSEVIKEYFKDGSDLGIQIKYLNENKRLGTGGSLSLIDFELSDPFFVVNGDVLSSIDYENLLNFHNDNKSNATMCIRKDSYQIPYGVIQSDEASNITAIVEKPINNFFINTGTYVLNPNILKYIPKDTLFDLPSLFQILKTENKNIKSYESGSYWIDMGKPEDYIAINEKMNGVHE
jgi:dTDP-glucose pyrophosphorylase